MNERIRIQLPTAVVMVRPAAFGFNPETAATNAFQMENTDFSRNEIQHRALREFDLMAVRLRAAGVDIHIVEDTPKPETPDAVFPNNWISFHDNGSVVLYPMFAANRRLERRADVIDCVKAAGYRVSDVIDLTHRESQNRYLEGTGSVVFDHVERCAYANISPRTDAQVLGELCERLGYKPITFRAVDAQERPIYHTNVMMSIGDSFAVVCVESISDPPERRLVVDSLKASGREIVAIDFHQLGCFAGNVLQVQTQWDRAVIVMSTQACLAFKDDQRMTIRKYAEIVETPLPMIESIEGGSARCMLAGVHLPRAS